MHLPNRCSFCPCVWILSLVLLSGCIAGPDFSTKSDRAALEEAYRAQSVAAQKTRALREDATIEELVVSSAPDGKGLLLTAALSNASRAEVLRQVFSHSEVVYQSNRTNIGGRVSARFFDQPLVDGLNILLSGTGLVAEDKAGMVHISNLILSGNVDLVVESDPGFISREIYLEHLMAEDATQLLNALLQKDIDESSFSFAAESIAELNAVFVSGPTYLVEEASRVIARADRPVAHVIIEALVVDIDTSSVEAIGLSFKDGANGKFSGFNIIPGQIGGNIVTTFSDLASNSAQVTATIEFLAAQNAAEIIARPYISTRSATAATIEIVSDQFARVDTSGDDASIISTDSITAGVTMQITPVVTGDDSVGLDLTLEESRFGIAAGDIIITKDRSSASTSMVVKSGHTMVVGGLNSKYRITENSGLPWLRNIPVLNALTGEQGSIETRQQLVVYLTPYIWIPEQDTPLPLRHLPDAVQSDPTSLERLGRIGK